MGWALYSNNIRKGTKKVLSLERGATGTKVWRQDFLACWGRVSLPGDLRSVLGKEPRVKGLGLQKGPH